MPIYEYRCDACGHEFEQIQKISEDPLQECPDCGDITLRKLMSAAGFRLKGGGWYETDFKKGSKKNLHDSGGGKDKASAPSTPKSASKSASASKSSGGKT